MPNTPIERPRTAAEDSRQTAIDVAVLKEQVNTLGREMGELKRVNTEQSQKLDAVLLQLSEARGGLRTVLYVGGAMAAAGGSIVWILERLLGVKA